MSNELLLNGVACSLACDYCYQQPIRDAGNATKVGAYDLVAAKEGLSKLGGKFTVFGGEPLLTPLADLEEIFRWGMERYGSNGIQTHGADMTEDHVRLFLKYKVGVGMSIDGPGELNDARKCGDLERTRAATARSIASLERLLDLGQTPSLIVTIHRLNASPERLPRLVEWLSGLADRGLKWVNLHLLEVDDPRVRETLSLTAAENAAALLAVAPLQVKGLRVAPLIDMLAMLRGDDRQASCIWHACDPYTTSAVQGVDGHGELGNCGRTCKEGPFWAKASTTGFERYLGLYHVPMSEGGCGGCRFFFACKGQCPGEGIGGDWRAKTEHCEALMTVFEALEAQMEKAGELPMSRDPLRPAVEQVMIGLWERGQNEGIRASMDRLQQNPTDPLGIRRSGGNWHGDLPHGDHTDAGRAQGAPFAWGETR